MTLRLSAIFPGILMLPASYDRMFHSDFTRHGRPTFSRVKGGPTFPFAEGVRSFSCAAYDIVDNSISPSASVEINELTLHTSSKRSKPIITSQTAAPEHDGTTPFLDDIMTSALNIKSTHAVCRQHTDLEAYRARSGDNRVRVAVRCSLRYLT